MTRNGRKHTLQTVLILSCSSLESILGGWPAALASAMGLPVRQKTQLSLQSGLHLTNKSHDPTVVSVLWSGDVIRDRSFCRERIHRTHGAGVFIAWERVVRTIWSTMNRQNTDDETQQHTFYGIARRVLCGSKGMNDFVGFLGRRRVNWWVQTLHRARTCPWDNIRTVARINYGQRSHPALKHSWPQK